MRYAQNANGERIEATPKQHAFCLCCGAEVIAKCGKRRAFHWAHKHKGKCHYSAKEPKTEWHIQWQDHFPKEWQEERCVDEQTGEIHIADIKTPYGLVIEFQHSPIEDEERISRENFYRNMIWVVDGTRTKKMRRQGKGLLDILCGIQGKDLWHEELYGITGIYRKDNRRIFSYKNPENGFPPEWLSCRVPVFFDYREDSEQMLVGIIPYMKKNFLVLLTKQDFVSDILAQKDFISDIKKIISYKILSASPPRSKVTQSSRVLLLSSLYNLEHTLLRNLLYQEYPRKRQKFRF